MVTFPPFPTFCHSNSQAIHKQFTAYNQNYPQSLPTNKSSCPTTLCACCHYKPRNKQKLVVALFLPSFDTSCKVLSRDGHVHMVWATVRSCTHTHTHTSTCVYTLNAHHPLQVCVYVPLQVVYTHLHNHKHWREQFLHLCCFFRFYRVHNHVNHITLRNMSRKKHYLDVGRFKLTNQIAYSIM